MSNRITLSVTILVIFILIVNNLTGSTRTTSKKWIVPATVVNKDTIPVVNFPLIIINGNKKINDL